jgi:hypothetical protein
VSIATRPAAIAGAMPVIASLVSLVLLRQPQQPLSPVRQRRQSLKRASINPGRIGRQATGKIAATGRAPNTAAAKVEATGVRKKTIRTSRAAGRTTAISANVRGAAARSRADLRK